MNKKVFAVIQIIISVLAIAYAMIVEDFAGQIIVTFPNKKLIRYSYLNQIADMLPQLFLSIIMGVAIYSVTFIISNDYTELIIKIAIGIIIYFVGSNILHIDSYEYLVNFINLFSANRRNHK